jgi:hypothetical protein
MRLIDLGPAAEDDMVLAFLRAAIDSARFGSTYRGILANSSLDRHSLIDNPDRNSYQANSIRRQLPKCVRGYSSNTYLFRGLPTDLTWRRVALDQTDLPKLKYANCPPWVELSRGTRLVGEGAKNIGTNTPSEDAAVNIRAVADDLTRGKRYAELIGVYDDNGDIILMEGHTRATAYVAAALPDRVECIVGSSTTIRNWVFY